MLLAALAEIPPLPTALLISSSIFPPIPHHFLPPAIPNYCCSLCTPHSDVNPFHGAVTHQIWLESPWGFLITLVRCLYLLPWTVSSIGLEMTAEFLVPYLAQRVTEGVS